MRELILYLRREASLPETVLLTFVLFPVAAAFCCGVAAILFRLCFGLKIKKGDVYWKIVKFVPWLNVAYGAKLGPLLEEFVFRLLPAFLVLSATRKIVPVLSVLLLASAFFGWFHGSGISTFVVYGIGGTLFNALFLKCGGFNRHYFKAFAAVAAAHYFSPRIFRILESRADLFSRWVSDLKVLVKR